MSTTVGRAGSRLTAGCGVDLGVGRARRRSFPYAGRMAIDNGVPDCAHHPNPMDDLAATVEAAQVLKDSSVATTQANRVIRALALRLGGDPRRLRHSATVCRDRAERANDANVRLLWRRAERLASNALALAEALAGPDPRRPASPDGTG
jgi:hypothetical protein